MILDLLGIHRFLNHFYDLLRTLLIFLGILPQGSIQIPHWYSTLSRQFTAYLKVFPPIVEPFGDRPAFYISLLTGQ
jgi:hypothetical protein